MAVVIRDLELTPEPAPPSAPQGAGQAAPSGGAAAPRPELTGRVEAQRLLARIAERRLRTRE